MDYNYIKNVTLNCFIECDIQSFPLSCLNILRHYNITVFSYSSLEKDLREYCMLYSDDAYSYKDKVFYNDSMPNGRIRFSLMHELGHVILRHGEERTPEMETEANCFASHFLAPRMAIHYSGCKNENDVAKLFLITPEAALYAFNDYKRWHRWVIYHKMDSYDKAIYNHFHSDTLNKFIYNIARCERCGEIKYNCGNCLPCLLYDFKHHQTVADPAFRYR